MALPALHALADLGGSLHIQAPGWGAALYRDVAATVGQRGPAERGAFDVAVLFPPSFRVAWQARRVPRRVGVAADARVFLLTDVVGRRAHRVQTYGALAEAVGATVAGPPTWTVRGDDPDVDVPDGHIGLNPISPSGEVVQWRGFGALAARSGRPVVFYGGPGEDDAVRAIAGRWPCRVGLPFPEFGRALSRCAVFVTNDSGAAHFARAVGTPTVVVHGSTAPGRTGAVGSFAVEGPALACRPCYRKRCHVGGVPCLDIGVSPVEAAVVAALRG